MRLSAHSIIPITSRLEMEFFFHTIRNNHFVMFYVTQSSLKRLFQVARDMSNEREFLLWFVSVSLQKWSQTRTEVFVANLHNPWVESQKSNLSISMILALTVRVMGVNCEYIFVTSLMGRLRMSIMAPLSVERASKINWRKTAARKKRQVKRGLESRIVFDHPRSF